MGTFFSGLLFTLLAVSAYWNYHSKQEFDTTVHDRDQTILSLNSELDRLHGEIAKNQNSLLNQKAQQQKIVDDLAAKLYAEKAVLESMLGNLGQSKNSASNQLELDRLTKELAQVNATVKDLDGQIHGTEGHLNTMGKQGNEVAQEQAANKKSQDADMNAKIQTMAAQIKVEQSQSAALKRNRYDYAAKDRASAMDAQIVTDRATLDLMRDQKKQFDQDASSDHATTDAQIKSYKMNSQETISQLRARKSSEAEKIPGLTRAIAQLKQGQELRNQGINRESNQVTDERKKVQVLEQQLKDQQDILNRL
jgi:hypothetical protein